MTKSIALFSPFAALLLVSLAVADDQPAAGGADASATFAQLDANKDGQLTADEISEDKKRLFERLVRTSDKNSDGKLSLEEFTAGLQPKPGRTEAAPLDGADGGRRPEKLFARLDANGDGKVTADEVPEPLREMFKRVLARGDKNGDGTLTKDEFLQAGPPDGAPAGKPARPDLAANKKGPEGRPNPMQLFRRMDKNGDGKLTPEEVPEERRQMIRRLMQRADKDGDKSLTLEEFSAGLADARPGNGNPPGKAAKQLPAGGAPGFPPAGLFRALDTDHDGELSSAEISAAAEVIRKLDKNADGKVTVEELMALKP